MKLGDNYRLMGDLPGAHGPDDELEEPEVWCRSCQWFHPRAASCLFGRNQPQEKNDA